MQHKLKNKKLQNAIFWTVLLIAYYDAVNFYLPSTLTNKYLYLCSPIPYMLTETIVQILSKFQNSRIYDLKRLGYAGNLKIQKIILRSSIGLTALIGVVNNLYLSIVKMLFIVLISVILNYFLGYLIQKVDNKGLGNGILIIFSVIILPDLTHTFQIFFSFNLLISIVLISAIIALIAFLLTAKRKEIILIEDQIGAATKGYLYLSLNVSSIMPLILAELLYVFTDIKVDYIKYILYIISIIFFNFIYATIATDPIDIADDLLKHHTCLLIKNKKYILAEQTEKYLKKRIYILAIWSSLILSLISGLSLLLGMITHNIDLAIFLGVNIEILLQSTFLIAEDTERYLILKKIHFLIR